MSDPELMRAFSFYEAGYEDGKSVYAPLPVTVDDEHASPVTGWVMRLPEEMGAQWLIKEPKYPAAPIADAAAIGEEAAYQQAWTRSSKARPASRAADYAEARWWAAAYRVVLAAERGEQ